MSVGELVIIGASWGGLHAVGELLRGLPAGFGLPAVVVQHRSEDGDDALAPLLDRDCALSVRDAEDKEPLRPGTVLVAPRGYHLYVGAGHVELSTDDPVSFSRPSIDVAMCSAADAYGAGAVGVVLTGANDDGADGLAEIRRRGGLAIVQDPGEAESPTMPEAAIAAAAPQHVLGISAIAALLAAGSQVTSP